MTTSAALLLFSISALAPRVVPLALLLIPYPVGIFFAISLPITTHRLSCWLGSAKFSLNPGPATLCPRQCCCYTAVRHECHRGFEKSRSISGSTSLHDGPSCKSTFPSSFVNPQGLTGDRDREKYMSDRLESIGRRLLTERQWHDNSGRCCLQMTTTYHLGVFLSSCH